jgi:hypothetical protein
MYIPGRLSHGDNVQDKTAFGRTLESHAGGYQKSGRRFLKRVTGRIFKN